MGGYGSGRWGCSTKKNTVEDCLVLNINKLVRDRLVYSGLHAYGTLNWTNTATVRLRHEVGIDRIMWGADFPHVESEWPNSRKVLADRFKGVPEKEQHKMVAGNAIEFFHLNGA